MSMIKPLRPEVLTLAASVCLLALFNFPLWRHVAVVTQHNNLTLALAFAALLVFAFNLVLALVAGRWTLKPLLMLLFPVSAGAAWFMSQYGIVIDAAMFRNIAETDSAEVRDLLSLKFVIYMFLCGVVPALAIWRLPVSYRKGMPAIVSKLLAVTASAALMAAIALSNYQGLSSLFRNHHELRLLVVPSNLVGAGMAYLNEQVASARQPFVHIGTDAHKSAAWAGHARPSITVLVIGESARADNFGILGYGRDTTPALAAEDGVLAFRNVHSCGTETAVSVPCMFSGMGRQAYDAVRAQNQEGVLDVLQRAGLKVLWLDNQSGCKGTCTRVAYQNLTQSKDPRYCDSECHDDILLKDVPALLANLTQDTVLVLHQMGSHGPDYYKRYPAGFEHFTPVCTSNALDTCARDSIVNAYDNSIRYTDHVLSTLIDTLRSRQDHVDSALLYLSDHGESLGEYNLYLHGTPYMLAPDQQKHVPLMAWFSSGYRRTFQVDTQCLEHHQSDPLSQDNLFSSLLGLLQIDTSVYAPRLDLFAGCRS
ncbi:MULTISPECIES: phosphoethanolamine transferase [Pseudomonas]|uniref:Phosphoethanolamine--lipid A transferase n=1 Tax=Pseudomonas quercus TaxID=2722792 RepID=A0ABX0YH50_9PSED|nr:MULTISPECIES: phosphoethanolamine--lipid A transferase [Pseudomonas]MBF7143571.1 phosphoethanolamine--lipid A transferase [Pseudomonas sp. LY10J]NJP02237.1 phosphoethanolamine--lipid A transferase [Pseudomonas quercus]